MTRLITTREKIEVDDNTGNVPDDRLLPDSASLDTSNDRLAQQEKGVKDDEEPDNNQQETFDDKSTATTSHENTSNAIETQVKDDTSTDLSNTKVETRNKKKRKVKEKKKSPEEAQMEGVGFWARMCESQGDFEVPNVTEETIEPRFKNANKDNGKEEPKQAHNIDSTRKTRSGRKFSSRVYNTKGGKLNIDKPSKEQVDRQQEEMDNITWEDRWHQNKNVQKVMKHSQLMSKVRSNIKIKLKDPEGLADQISTSNIPESAIPANTSTPSSVITTSDNTPKEDTGEEKEAQQITGSMEDYANIVGKTAEDLEKEQLEDLDKESDVDESDEDEGNDDDLWGAIMGSKS